MPVSLERALVLILLALVILAVVAVLARVL